MYKKKQFHHVNPDEKTRSVAQMVHMCYPKEEIIEEMNKCVLVCNRCHCKIHAEMKRKARKLAEETKSGSV